jgi:hypothetical protein
MFERKTPMKAVTLPSRAPTQHLEQKTNFYERPLYQPSYQLVPPVTVPIAAEAFVFEKASANWLHPHSFQHKMIIIRYKILSP